MNFIEKIFPELAGKPAAVIAITLSVALVFYVLLVIAEWKMFVKMGEKGWKAIIPVYNLYILIKKCSKLSHLWQLIAAGVLIVIIDILYYAKVISTEANWSVIVFGLLQLAAIIWAVVIEIKVMHGVSKSFGHGAGFTVGLILLGFVFQLILGFGNSQYQAVEQKTKE
ncbi:MAG: DUF5684 domain-containing protein [Candidatus Coproplasma sp.]